MMAVIADPDFPANGFIYAWYTDKRQGNNGQNRVSRFTIKGDAVDTQSEKLMISLGDAGINYHHGGGLAIADGKMFIASGCRGGILVDLEEDRPSPARVRRERPWASLSVTFQWPASDSSMCQDPLEALTRSLSGKSGAAVAAMATVTGVGLMDLRRPAAFLTASPTMGLRLKWVGESQRPHFCRI